MVNKAILWIFPLITQIIFSLFLPFFSGFNLNELIAGFGYVALLATFPAFIFALFCYRKRLHQRNLLQITMFSGGLMFIYTLILFSVYLAIEPTQEPISTWEHSLAVFFYALMFALPSSVYAMVILRLFLPKMIISQKAEK
ncbi:hypothetical protein ACWIUH_01215 [Ursidibacter arcticus]